MPRNACIIPRLPDDQQVVRISALYIFFTHTLIMLVSLILIIFVIGYLAITLEHNLKVNKSAVALATGGIVWVLASIVRPEHLHDAFVHTGAEIFEIVIFLLSAMSLVEVLVHYQFFDVIKAKINAYNLDDKRQFLLLTGTTFFLSAVIDNLTATLVMLFMAKQFFKKPNLYYVAAGIVIAANAGGAFSPLGDVTTIMLWLAGKFGTAEIVVRGFLPAAAMAGVAIAMIYPRVKNGDQDTQSTNITTLSRSEKIVIATTFASFGLPLLMSLFDLPPYIGLLIGLGVVWLLVDIFKQISKQRTHLEVSLEQLIAKTDLASIKFFVGILLAVSALNHIGILEQFGNVIYQQGSYQQVIIGNSVLGLISAVLDNVPLTAMAIKILHTPITSLWILLAITVGTGGSLLIVGSAAGVIAMGSIPALSFKRYVKIAFVPVMAGYLAAIAVWYAQSVVMPLPAAAEAEHFQESSFQEESHQPDVEQHIAR